MTEQSRREIYKWIHRIASCVNLDPEDVISYFSLKQMLRLLPKGENFALDAQAIIASKERATRHQLSLADTSAIETYCDAASAIPDTEEYHYSRLGERLVYLLESFDFASLFEAIHHSWLRKAILRHRIVNSIRPRKKQVPIEKSITLPGLIIKHAFIGSIINISTHIGSRGIFKSFSLLLVGIVGEFAQQLSSLRDSRFFRLISRYIYTIYDDIKSNRPLNYFTLRERWLGYATLWNRWKVQDRREDLP